MNIKCKYCNRIFPISIEQKDYIQIEKSKNHISEIAYYLEAWEREMLISQTCDKCWKNMYGENQ